MLVNKCLMERVFPSILKIGKVIPIHKDGDKTSANNYRPITKLNVFSKILEKVLFVRLNYHLQVNKIISSVQFGFTDNSNTTSACMEFTRFISSAIDNKYYVGCIYIDLTKAFDTVNHQILINKLYHAGVNSDDLEIFKSFLYQRQQAVYVNDTLSEFLINTIGIPQGSILGPLLFNLYINDLAKLNLAGEVQLFADDIALKYKTRSMNDLYTQMQSDLDTLEEWFGINKLIINVKKSKYMIFKNHKVDTKEADVLYGLKCGTEKLELVDEYKYLGLTITSDLKWNRQIDEIKKKIVPYIFSLAKLKYILPKVSMKLIYYAYIHTHFVYLNPIWSGVAAYKISELQILQKRALKNVLNVHWSFPTKLIFKSEFIDLETLIHKELLLLVFKIINNLIKHNNIPIQANSIHKYATRSQFLYVLENYTTNRRNNDVFYKGFHEFNQLPQNLKEIKTLEEFKVKLMIHLHTPNIKQ